MQGEWANMYESAADYFGRAIRYDEIPAGKDEASLVSALREISTRRVAGIESLRNEAEALRRLNSNMLSGLDQFDFDDTLPSSIGEALDIRAEIDERLARAQSEETRDAQRAGSPQGYVRLNERTGRLSMPGFLVLYNRKSRQWRVTEFLGADGAREAFLRRLELERKRTDDDWEIASLNADSLETVQKTHARYFEGEQLVSS